MRPLDHLTLVGSLCSLALVACGPDPVAHGTATTTINIDIDDDAWTRKVQFETHDDHSELVLDGVKFVLLPDAQYELKWESIGVEGQIITNRLDYKTNKDDAVSPLLVDGRLVELAAGELLWGETNLGAIAAGDEVRVSAEGVEIQ